MPARAVIRRHPCFSARAHSTVARIHLPVAPRCNISCAYCDRKYDCANESRPGVTSRIMSPGEAVDFLERSLQTHPQIRVVGIAGPGEPLYNAETFAALRMVRNAHPDLMLCLSTNGFLLPDRIEELLACGVSTLTITLNTLREKTAATIYPGMSSGSDFLLTQQYGLELAIQNGLVVKINTVLIPDVNAAEIGEIAEFVAAKGAHMMNIIPLIPCGEMIGLKPPSREALREARGIAGNYIPQFIHCKRCRADAVGIPGEADIPPLFETAHSRGL